MRIKLRLTRAETTSIDMVAMNRKKKYTVLVALKVFNVLIEIEPPHRVAEDATYIYPASAT